jgi:hypothetical protein
MRGIVIVFLLLFSLSAQGQMVIDSYRFGAPADSLLDTYSGASAAYSLRLLRTEYTGNCIMVRRSSDGDSTNIGFSNGTIDTVALNTFCSSTNCFVRVWYDQSGNSNNLRQTTSTAQAIINDSIGGIVRINGKVSLRTDNNDSYSMTTNISFSNLTWFTVTRRNSGGGTGRVIFYATSATYAGDNVDNLGNPNLDISSTRVIGVSLSNTSSASGGAEDNQHLSYYNRAGTLASGGLNGEVKTPATVITTAFVLNSIFNYGSNYNFNGWAQELILYNSDQSSNRAAIETNINNFYSIY